MKIKVLGPYPAWDERARQGVLERDEGGEVPVLIRPWAAPDGEVEAARAEGRLVGALRHPRVLPLRQVAPAPDGVFAVYDSFPGVALARALEAAGGRLPPRVAFELASMVADALEAAWSRSTPARRVVHPGPTPDAVLVSAEGQVRVAGLRAPVEPGALVQAPGWCPPEGPGRDGAIAYGVGALLLTLLGGDLAAVEADEPQRHAATLRRELIAVVARPGPRLPESALELVRRCLSWKLEERPAASSLAGRLGVAAAGLPPPGVERWCREDLARLWAALGGAAPDGAVPDGAVPGGAVPGGAAPDGVAPDGPRAALPMAVGPVPAGFRMDLAPPTMVPEDVLDEPTEGASRLPTEQVRRPELGPDAPTVEDTEEIERTQDLPGGEGAEVTVSTPRPEVEAPSQDRTVMSRFEAPPRGGAPVPVPIRLDGQRPYQLAPRVPRARGPAGEGGAAAPGEAGAVRGDAARGDAARGDAARGDAARGDAARGDAVAEDAADEALRPRRRGGMLVAAAAAAAVALGVGGWWLWGRGAGQGTAGDPGALPAAEAADVSVGAGATAGEGGGLPPEGGAAAPALDGTAAEGEALDRATEQALAAAEAAAAQAAAAEAAAAQAAAAEAAAAQAAAAEAAAEAAVAQAAAQAADVEAAAQASRAAPAPTTRGSAAPATPSQPARGTSDEVDEVDEVAAYIAPAPAPTGSAAPAAPAPAASAEAPSAAPAPSSPTAPASAAPASAAPAPPAPTEVAPAPPAPAEAPPFTLRFVAAPGVASLEVTCHGGHAGSGAEVRIPSAVPGPCRVSGTTADGGRLVTVVAIDSSGAWTCFAGGERSCR